MISSPVKRSGKKLPAAPRGRNRNNVLLDPSAKIISIGDRVFPGEYRIHSRFRRVVNFVRGERLVAVAAEEVGRGPVNIVVRGIDPEADDTLKIGAESIRIGESSFSRAGVEVYDSRWWPGKIDRTVFGANLIRFERFILEAAPAESLAFLLHPDGGRSDDRGFAAGMREAIAEAARFLFRSRGDLIAGCEQLKGLGYGLTPGGDDLIAGLLTALAVLDRLDGVDRSGLRKEMVAASRTGNLLAGSFIAQAAEGRFFERLKNLLDALAADDHAVLIQRSRELVSFGASSGSDLAAGLLLGLKNFSRGEKSGNFARRGV